MIYAQASMVWLAFGVVAVSLGALREHLLGPRVGALHAHQIETLAVYVVIFAIIVVFVRWTRPCNDFFLDAE